MGFPQGHEGPHRVVATSSQPQGILALETGTRRPSDEVAPPAVALPPGSSRGFSLPASLGASMRGTQKLGGSDTPQLRGDRFSWDLPDRFGVPRIHLGHAESRHQHPVPSSAGPALTPKLVPCACPHPIYPTSRGRVTTGGGPASPPPGRGDIPGGRSRRPPLGATPGRWRGGGGVQPVGLSWSARGSPEGFGRRAAGGGRPRAREGGGCFFLL